MGPVTTTALRSSLSPYLAVLESEISDDLRRIVTAEDLRDEVRKTLLKRIASEAQQACYNLASNASYGSEDAVRKSEAEARRYARYLLELLDVRDAQRIDASHQIGDGRAD